MNSCLPLAAYLAVGLTQCVVLCVRTPYRVLFEPAADSGGGFGDGSWRHHVQVGPPVFGAHAEESIACFVLDRGLVLGRLLLSLVWGFHWFLLHS